MSSQKERARVPLLPLLARLELRRPQRRAAGYAVGLLGTIALSASALAFRGGPTPLTVGFGFLVVVVAATAAGGLGPGILTSLLGFLAFNFFFLPPYGTFTIARAEDVVVLFVFLGLATLISALLAHATDRAAAAEAREQEVRTLQALSAELVALVPGPGSYQTILSRLVDVFGFAAGALYLQHPQLGELREQVTVGAAPGAIRLQPDPGADPNPPLRLPLSAGGRALGLLLLGGDRPALDQAERRVLRSFCDQFALVLERDRMLDAATETEAFRRTEQVRRSLLAAVSHDLRSPLAGIKASVTDLLGRDGQAGAADAREALESIDQEADRLGALIANLLDMSRIEAGMLKARPRNVDLAEVLSPGVDRLQRQWPLLRVRLEVEEADHLVSADPVFLDRVVANLLDNAAKAASDSGRQEIEVRAEGADGDTTVRVVDHGRGVPLTDREQLFYPFYQLGERHPRLGTGLGLAISKGFLSLMNGQIWIEETPGGGATFAFSLPTGAGAG